MVSILARAEARALHFSTISADAHIVFQSSPAPRRGRYFGNFFAKRTKYPFQSSPAPRRGRY